MTNRTSCVALALAVLAGSTSALAQNVDGVRDAAYGAPVWVNTNPTQFGDSGNQNPCDPNGTGGDPGAVTTGVEFSIPVAAIGGFGIGASIKMVAGINGQSHDFFSNQWLPSLPPGTGNLGEPRNVNLTAFAGNQHAEFVPALVSEAPIIDGTSDAGYGAAIALQGARTGFGNATSGQVDTANGSELDGMYVVRYDNGTPLDASDDVLYVMLTGNFESNFNKPEIFFDTVAGGQNRLLGTNVDVDFNGLNRMGESPAGAGNGLTFDAGFEPDFWLGGGGGGAPVTFFPNYATLPTDGVGSTGSFQGCYAPVNVGGLTSCGNDSTGLRWTFNNSNTAGVEGGCPPPAGSRDSANGSEIDAVYATLVTGEENNLYIFVAGNLETGGGSASSNDGNKLMLFIDAQPGGQNRMRGDNVDISFGNLNRMGDEGTGNGLTWDAAFSPDYWLQYKNVGAVGAVNHVVDAAVLRTDGRRIVPFLGGSLDYGAYYGGPKSSAQYRPAIFLGNSAVAPAGFVDPNPQDGSIANIYTNFAPRLTAESLVAGQIPPYSPPFNEPVGSPHLIAYDMDNSNIAGITGAAGTGGETVTTGFELRIDLTELGWDGTSPILLGGFVINNDGTFLSNQVIGGLPEGTGNLAGDVRNRSFEAIAGNQYIVLVPGANDCPADFNDDGNVDPDDLADFITCFFLQVQFPGVCPAADFNGDTFVDPDDLSDFITIFFLTGPNGCV